MEVWKTVVIDGVTYDGYEVSNYGKVRSLNYNRTGKVQELKPCKDRNGYLTVVLCQKDKQRSFLVHRLVACTYIPNPENKPTVNHINENKEDNRVENLEWATMKEQVQHGTSLERRSKKVLCVETGVIYDSTMEVERQTGLSHGNISKCCKGKYKTCGGYHWEYVE